MCFVIPALLYVYMPMSKYRSLVVLLTINTVRVWIVYPKQNSCESKQYVKHETEGIAISVAASKLCIQHIYNTTGKEDHILFGMRIQT